MGCSSGIISAVIPFARRNYLCCVFAATTVSMFARFAFGICKSQNQKCVWLEPVGRLRQHHQLHHLVSRWGWMQARHHNTLITCNNRFPSPYLLHLDLPSSFPYILIDLNGCKSYKRKASWTSFFYGCMQEKLIAETVKHLSYQVILINSLLRASHPLAQVYSFLGFRCDAFFSSLVFQTCV